MAYCHAKGGEYRQNIQQRMDEHAIIENIIPSHATWLVQPWEPLIACFKVLYSQRMAKMMGQTMDLRLRPSDGMKNVTFEQVCDCLARTWEEMPNAWLLLAFVKRKFLTLQQAAIIAQVDEKAFGCHDEEMKKVIQEGILMRIIKEDDAMLAEVWPERKVGKKRRRATATAKASGSLGTATASAYVTGDGEATAVAEVE